MADNAVVRPWVDNGAWANAVARIEYSEGGEVAIGLSGFAQLYRQTPALDPDGF